MFEKLAKDYALKKAPSTVIPVGVSIKDAMEKYHLDHVYKLASNENPYGVSPKALEAMTEALKTGYLYPDSTRDTVLRNKLAKLHGVNINQVMVTCGAANAIAYACEAFIKPGVECIVPSPAYPPYFYNVFKNDGVIIDVPSRESDMKIDLDVVLSKVNEKTGFIFVCNPNNPTGTAYKAKEIVDFIKKVPTDVIVMVDEAYIDFTDNPKEYSLMGYLKDFPNMIVIRTYSKIYGMAAIRAGYAIACEEIIKYMNKAVAARSLSTISIEGAIAALDDEEFRQKTILNNKKEREYLTSEFTALGYKVYESQANFIYVDFYTSCQDLYFKLLPYSVMIRGDFAKARISIGTHEQNEALVNAIKDLKAKGEV